MVSLPEGVGVAGAVVDSAAATSAAGAGAASLAGFSLRPHAAMSNAAKAAVVARANDLPCITRLPGSGERHYCKQSTAKPCALTELRPQSIEPLNESPGIGKLSPFGQHRLFEDHQCELVELGGILAILQILHQVMFDIELEHRLAGRSLLSRGFQRTPQRRGDVMFAGSQHRGGILETSTDARFGDPVSESILDALEQRFALLE